MVSVPDSQPTPDWFHTCSEIEGYSPPQVAFGTQEPQDGGGYVGIGAYTTNNPNYREVVGVELTEPLMVNTSYLVEFYVSNITFPEFAIASNKMGFNFSTHQFYNLEIFPLNTSHYSVEEIIPLSDEWYLISHVFTADSAYNYLHIGNFYSDENTAIDTSINNSGKSYYVIDNVSVSSLLSNNDVLSERKECRIYPNPVDQDITVWVPDDTPIQIIRLISATGKVVKVTYFNNFESKIKMNTAYLTAGAYILQIVTPKTSYNETFIKL